MKESFLHFVWKFQYFDKKTLKTFQNEDIQVYHPGVYNLDSGPDFSQARISIDNIQWHGNVEIHTLASDWYLHQHQDDDAYDNVVLHVVWDNDKPVSRKDGTRIPVLELKNRISQDLILSYRKLINNPQHIPCSSNVRYIPELIKNSMLDHCLTQRLESRGSEIYQLLENNIQDWEETSYQWLAQSFGFKLNKPAFETLSHALPYKVVKKHNHNLVQLEALLFGQAGFLQEDCQDQYFKGLKKEYQFLSHKYQLSESRMDKFQWKFMRTRPSNFPTIRIAQLASLLHKRQHIFQIVKQGLDPVSIIGQLKVEQSNYWKEHYQFGKPAKNKISGLGRSSIEGLLINTICPLLVAYGNSRGEYIYVEGALKLLQNIKAEENRILKMWKNLGINVSTAADSQALIQLYHQFCQKKRCLECKMGVYLMNNTLK